MRIAVFHNQPSGGARRALHGFVRALSTRNAVDVYTLSTSDGLLADEVAISYQFAPRPPIRFAFYVNDWRRRLDLRDLERVQRRVARDIDESGYDVVLVDVDRFVGAPFVLQYLSTPTAYYCHEPPRALYETAWRPHATTYQRLRRIWREPLERSLERRLKEQDRSLARQAGVVITNSRFTRARIATAYGVDAVVCPAGIDPAPRLAAGSGNRVLSVGAMEPHKGFAFLIEAIAAVSGSIRPPLTLVSNDQNPAYRAHIERLADASGVDLSIRLRITDVELSDEYANAALFAFAAHDEPLGLAPLEAMAHGLPVLAVAEGGLNETVVDGETGVLVPRDVRVFAEAVEELLASGERRRRLGDKARAVILERWNWPARSAALESELNRLVSRAAESDVSAVSH